MHRFRFLFAVIVVFLAGCSSVTAAKTASTPAASPAAQAQVFYTCPVSIPAVRVTNGGEELCPMRYQDASVLQAGYGDVSYLVRQRGTVEVTTHGGGQQLVLLAADYLLEYDDGNFAAEALVFMKPATSYGVASSVTCPGSGVQHLHAVLQGVETYLPEDSSLTPSRLPTWYQGMRIASLDPSFGLQTNADLTDALCAK